MAESIKLLTEPVDYFAQGDRVQAVIMRTLPNGQRVFVDEYALTPHAAVNCLYGVNGKIKATHQVLKSLGIPIPDLVLEMDRAQAALWQKAIEEALKSSDDNILKIVRRG